MTMGKYGSQGETKLWTPDKYYNKIQYTTFKIYKFLYPVNLTRNHSVRISKENLRDVHQTWTRDILHTDQEGAEEDEGNKVEVGKVTSTLISHSSWEFIAGAVTQARQHDLVPRLTCGTSEEQMH